MLRTLKLLVLTLVTSASTIGFAQAEAIAWRTDLRSAQIEAEQSGKLVLIHFYTDSCGPCRLLDKNVFSMPNVATALESNYVPVKMNANHSPDVARAYGVTRVPTDVITDTAGKQVKKLVSPATPMAYVGMMTNLAGQHRSVVGSYDQIARSAPSPSALQAGTNRLNPAYASLSNTPPNVAPAAVPSASNPMASNPTAPSVVGNRYAMAPAVQAPTAVETGLTQPAAAQPTANSSSPSLENPYFGTQAAPVAPANPQIAVQPTPAQPTVEKVATVPPAVTQADESVTPIVEKTAEISKQVAVTPTVKLPAGSPPLGFDGYCAVTMKEKWQWVKGDVKWGAIHRGRTYLFTDEASRDKFLASPDTFSPALSGSDPVLAVDSRQSVPGTREYALEYEGKFYFFSSEQTLNKFWTNADGYAKGSERVAAALQTDGKIVR